MSREGRGFLLSSFIVAGFVFAAWLFPQPSAFRNATVARTHTACKVAIGPSAWERYPGFQRRKEISGPDRCQEMTPGLQGVFVFVDEDQQPCFFLNGKGECWFVPIEAVHLEDQKSES
jgi:hypothetical protein